MGIIRRQTIKGSVYSYLGVITGFFATAIITPRLLTPGEIGLITVLVALSALYSQFSTLGFTNVSVRMFAWFRNNENNHNGFPFLLVATGMTGFLLALAAFFILKPQLIENNIEQSPLLVRYIWYLIPLIFFRLFLLLFDNYNMLLYDSTTGTLLTDLVYRLANLTLLGAFYLEWIRFPGYLFAYVAAWCFPAVYLGALLISRRQLSLRPQLAFVTPALRKEMLTMAAFGIIGGLSGVAMTSIDKIMVNSYFGLNMTGVYTISSYFATIILIPNRSLSKISSAFLSEAWKKNDLNTINDIYYKSSINQSVIGCLLFILMMANLDNIYDMLPATYGGGAMIIILIALGNLLAVSTGVSVNILSTSAKYKMQTYQLGLLILLTVGTNFLFIPMFGIYGAALASMTSMAIYSAVRVVYLKKKMQLFPYRFRHLKLLALSACVLLAGMLLPRMGHWIIDAMARSALMLLAFGSGLLLLNVSDEVSTVASHAAATGRKLFFNR